MADTAVPSRATARPGDTRERRAPGINQSPVPARPDAPVSSDDRPQAAIPPGRASREVVSTDADVRRLEARARSMVRATGCTGAGDCRSAPVGNRACGGPRTYLVYCRTSTDSVALQRVLDELARAERAANQRDGMMSTCDFRMPPNLGFELGRCVSK